ncbi:MAG: TatD family hydrolase [Patescibacteria group bacterium]
MNPNFVDVHAHIHSKEFDTDRADVLSRMKKSGTWAITVGTDLESSRQAVALAQSTEGVFATIGQHPADNRSELFDSASYELLTKSLKVVGIGECGLDFFRTPDTAEEKKRQSDLFEQQIEFAVRHDKPLMIHCRNAYEEVLSILHSSQKKFGDKVRGNVHFFAGDVSVARKFLNMGFTLSFTGVLTFTIDYDEVVSFVPLTSILSETDCPFVAPVPFRGKRNEPSFVSFTVERIVQIKKLSVGRVKETLVSNAITIFNLAQVKGL